MHEAWRVPIVVQMCVRVGEQRERGGGDWRGSKPPHSRHPTSTMHAPMREWHTHMHAPHSSLHRGVLDVCVRCQLATQSPEVLPRGIQKSCCGERTYRSLGDALLHRRDGLLAEAR